MADNTVVRVGQINQTGDVQALFLKVFAGEVLTAFHAKNLALGRTQVRTISNGKSAQFPRTGLVSARYHVPGTEITGDQANQAEVVIPIDDLLISDVSIANIDEAMNHYDIRSIYSNEMGEALARAMDLHILQTAVLAARGSNVVNGLPGGSQITLAAAGDELDGVKFAATLFKAAQILDEKNVPEEGRTFWLRPAQYYALAQNTTTINQFWGGRGSYAEGSVLKVAGFELIKTNNLPSTVVANGTVEAGTGDRYAGDFSNTVGLALHSSAVGTVKLLDLGMESEYSVRRQSTLMVGKYACGHGILRPEAAVEVVKAAA
jgi:hypothetical protein